METKKKEKITAYITINDKYRFSIDNMSKTLETNTEKGWKVIGYFTQLEPMFKMISRREADNSGAKTIQEYLQVIIDENRRVKELFAKLDFHV